MTPRQRMLGALHGDMVDRVPFTAYPNLLPGGECEQRLRAKGMGLRHGVWVFRQEYKTVDVSTQSFEKDGLSFTRTTYSTPIGQVSEVKQHGGGYGSTIHKEWLIKSPEDYRIVEYIHKDATYEPNYDAIRAAQEELGEDGLVVGLVSYDPYMWMLLYLLGHEQFSLDMYLNQDLWTSLYNTLVDIHRQLFDFAVDAPLELVHYGGNISNELIGKERYDQYCLPLFNEIGERLHAKGKLLGQHCDGNNRGIAASIAASELDVIEAFTPFPDMDMTMAEARAAWPDKIIWANFTSSMHLADNGHIRNHTLELLEAVKPGDRFLMGITENVPEHRCEDSLTTIADTLLEAGQLPLA